MKRITESELKARVNKLREYMAITEAEPSSVATGNTPPPPTVGKPKNPTLPASVPGSINNIAQGVKMSQMGMPTADQLEKFPQARPAAPAKPAAPAAPAKPAAPSGYQGSPKAQEIKKLNPDVIKDVNSIGVGKSIKLPDGSTYKIAPGDTLDAIGAGKYKGTPPTPAAPAAPAAATGEAPAATPDLANMDIGFGPGKYQPDAAAAPLQAAGTGSDSEEGQAEFDPTWGGTVAPADTRNWFNKNLNPFSSAPQAANQNATWNNAQQRAVSNPPAPLQGVKMPPAPAAPATQPVLDGSGKPTNMVSAKESVQMDEIKRLVSLVHYR